MKGEIPWTGSKGIRLVVCEDNEAVIKLVMKQRSMALRHVTRTHRIGLDWIFQVMQDPNIALRYVTTKQQIADMMTKAISKKEIWTLADVVRDSRVGNAAWYKECS